MRALTIAALVFLLAGQQQCRAQEQDLNDYYFLVIEGRGMPIKQVVVNKTNVLGASALNVKMPINITEEVKKGLNELEVDFVSDAKEGLATRIEKRQEGPKIKEVVRVSANADESKGEIAHKAISFSVDSEPSKVKELKLADGDKEAILKLVQEYYDTLKNKKTGKLKEFYADAIRQENLICPEYATYFGKALKKEITLLKKTEVKMQPFSIDDVMIEIEQDKVRVLRKDRKPLMESNEIDVEMEPLLTEVGTKSAKQKDKVKQRLVTTKLLFKKGEGRWYLALPHGV
ncbi:MAG: hypothetical protein K2Z81_14105 [Cyanobacteria bacterium]|nr:hypothetical protein [Cyanobacteriota bacterium]